MKIVLNAPLKNNINNDNKLFIEIQKIIQRNLKEFVQIGFANCISFIAENSNELISKSITSVIDERIKENSDAMRRGFRYPI